MTPFLLALCTGDGSPSHCPRSPTPSEKWGREKQGHAWVERTGSPLRSQRGEAGKKPISLSWLQHPSIFNAASAAPRGVRGGSVLVASPGAGRGQCGLAPSTQTLDWECQVQLWGGYWCQEPALGLQLGCGEVWGQVQEVQATPEVQELLQGGHGEGT